MSDNNFGGGGDHEPLRISFYGDNNTIIIDCTACVSGLINIYGNRNSLSFGASGNFNCNIYVGYKDEFSNNSRLSFGKNCKISNLTLSIVAGSNQIVQLGNNLKLDSRSIVLAVAGNSKLSINDNTTIVGAELYIGYDSSVIIEEDCMFSWNIMFMTRGGHTIIDKNTNNILNDTHNNTIHIGKHCWIGYGVNMLNSVTIPDNSIVGMNSFVINKQFDEPNVSIAGSPAKVIKHNIDWDRDIPKVYKEKLKEKVIPH